MQFSDYIQQNASSNARIFIQFFFLFLFQIIICVRARCRKITSSFIIFVYYFSNRKFYAVLDITVQPMHRPAPHDYILRNGGQMQNFGDIFCITLHFIIQQQHPHFPKGPRGGTTYIFASSFNNFYFRI